MEYSEIIKNAVNILCTELEKDFKGLNDQKYDSCGIPDCEGNTFAVRMEMGVYIELLKAGMIK